MARLCPVKIASPVARYLAEREALLGAVRTHDVQALGARELDVVTEVDAGDAPEAFLACLRVVLQQREEEEGERACDRLGRGGEGGRRGRGGISRQEVHRPRVSHRAGVGESEPAVNQQVWESVAAAAR